MDFVDQLERLERLRQQGLLSDAELELAKAKLLDGSGSSSADVEQADVKRLAKLEKEMELVRLDRAWEYEKQSHMIRGRHGRYIPSAKEGLWTAVIAACIGGGMIWLWSSFAADNYGSRTPPVWLLLLSGIFFIVGGIWSGLSMHSKAAQYESARRTYFERREEITRR